MTRQPTALVAAVFALALVTAGCAAPVAQSGSTPTDGNGTPTPESAGTTTNETDRQPIEVRNGSLSVDPNVVFDRVQRLQGTNVSRPTVVQVFNTAEGFRNQSSGIGSAGGRRFYALAGMEDGEVNLSESVTRQRNGYVTGLGSIVLYAGENTTRVDELLLSAHEFTHYVQFRSGRQERLASNLGDVTTTDRRYVLRAMIEGDAVVTTDAYLARYTNATATNSEWYTEIQSSLPAGHVARYENGKYVHGTAYVDSRVDSPSDVSGIAEDPPQTSEQVLHGLTPTEEPPVSLSVTVETGEEWVVSGSGRMGEAFVRTALESAVGTDRSVTAAAGWGNDTVRFLRPADGEGDTAYAWVFRWDDAANQTEFQSAYRQSLDRRGTETDGIWTLNDSNVSATLSAPTPRTSVVVFGPASLVRNVSITGADGEVTVSTP